jgi:hypothetical protein
MKYNEGRLNDTTARGQALRNLFRLRIRLGMRR